MQDSTVIIQEIKRSFEISVENLNFCFKCPFSFFFLIYCNTKCVFRGNIYTFLVVTGMLQLTMI